MTLTSFCDRDRSRTSHQQEVSIANGYCHPPNNFCPPAELMQLTGASSALLPPAIAGGVLVATHRLHSQVVPQTVDSKGHCETPPTQWKTLPVCGHRCQKLHMISL